MSTNQTRAGQPASGVFERGVLAGWSREGLLDKISREPFAAVFERLREAVRAAAEEDSRTTELKTGGWCHSQYFTPLVVEAAFVHALTGDEAALAHVVRQIDKLARVWADPPASFERELKGFRKGHPASSYFSSAHTAMAVDMVRGSLPQKALETMRRLCREHLVDDSGRDGYWLNHYNAGHNAVVTRTTATAIVSLLLGEESGHKRFRRAIELGKDACELHAYWSYDEAGIPFEGPMYAWVTIEWVFLFADLLKRQGGPDLLAALPKLGRVADAAARLLLPDQRGVPGFQDCRQHVTAWPMHWLPLSSRAYGRPQDMALFKAMVPPVAYGLYEILWWDGHIPEGGVPECGHPTCLIGAGTVVSAMRTSWSPDAVYLNVLGQGRSRSVPDHTHADAGHVTIQVGSELLAWDTGYYNFDEDQHSVVLIDDSPFSPTTQGCLYAGRLSRSGRHPLLDFVEIDAAACKGCMWALRTVLFIRGEGDFAYVAVLDNINRDNKTHAFKWQLQVPFEREIAVTGPASAEVRGATARLDCRFFKPLPADFPTAPHRLSVFADRHPGKAVHDGSAVQHPRLIAQLDGPNCNLVSLLIPRRAGEPPLAVVEQPTPRVFNVRVEHGPWIDQILYAPDHGWIRLPEVDAMTEAAVIRRTRAGDIVGIWSIDGEVRPRSGALA